MNLNQIVWLDFDYKNKHYEGEAIATLSVKNNCTREVFEIYFNNEYSGALCKHQERWVPDMHLEEDLARIISSKLFTFLKSELHG
jgi:hypothetical protein